MREWQARSGQRVQPQGVGWGRSVQRVMKGGMAMAEGVVVTMLVVLDGEHDDGMAGKNQPKKIAMQ